MRTIPLTQGKIALVDDEDFDWLNQWKWCALKRRHTWYAGRNSSAKNRERMTILMHREIVKSPVGMETDHKDHNGLNNWRSNLRMATTSQNHQNQKKQKGTTSHYKGVHWNRNAEKWRAEIIVNGKLFFLGYFDSETKAAKAYDHAARKYFGEFASLNFR